MRYFYNIIFYLLLPFILLRLLWRSRKSPAYRQRWAERFGFVKTTDLINPIWIHAVSFGEAKIATTLVEALLKLYPERQIVVTTMTVTGSEQISKALGKKVYHYYVPYDYPSAVKRFLKRIKPKLLIIVETELWPNILHYCGKAHVPITIANARLGERSTKGYQKISFLVRPILRNITQVLAQTDLDAKRFNQIGVPSERIHIAGNIKFDVTPPENLISQGIALRAKLGNNRAVFIAASTHKGEEEIVLQAFAKIRQKIPDALLILVPRHPERFDEIAALCEQQHYKTARRSHNNSTLESWPATDIYLGDTMGELWLFYAAADVAFVGGSLIPQGGHNLLEPAALGMPIITGPYLFNFKQIADFLQQQQALTLVDDEQQLATAILNLLENKELRTQQGERAKQVVIQNQGALQKHLQLLQQVITPVD